jgi:hypothetical protein
MHVLNYPISAEYLLHLRLFFRGMVKRARGLVFEKLDVKRDKFYLQYIHDG